MGIICHQITIGPRPSTKSIWFSSHDLFSWKNFYRITLHAYKYIKEESPESGSKKDANVSDMHRDVQSVQQIMDAARRDHKSRVYSTANNATERVPGPLIEPIQEVVETILDHVRCSSIIEPANY